MAIDPDIAATLAALLAAEEPTDAQWSLLIHWELADRQRAAAWGITPENVDTQLQTRLEWLRAIGVWPAAVPLPADQDVYVSLYWQLWLPLALTIKAARDRLQRPLIQGILGVQGCGKTTLTRILVQLLTAMGYPTLSFSLDDLYKTYADRCRLRQADPRLRWRGPPGTHDIDLGLATLDHLRRAPSQEGVDIPRFDKSLYQGEGDRIAPERVQGIDIVLFEGWFVGVRPVAEAQFEQAPAPICTEADRRFARDMNRWLQHYLPLWERLDRLLLLCPEDYRMSKRWRQQAEQRMRAAGQPGMEEATVDAFVDYFWRALHPELFITPLKHDRTITNLVIEINLDRTPRTVYRPK
ncbi:MAG: glycerate kinase [Leptolyngbyaceae cyanobacterium SM2_5_2]|nr:glycerate kinase [Leptolyngbyaceae cyanobacterium SM2_5_2]